MSGICERGCEWATKYCDENHLSGTRWMLTRIERMADGYHFAGLLAEEKTVREVLARLSDSKGFRTAEEKS